MATPEFFGVALCPTLCANKINQKTRRRREKTTKNNNFAPQARKKTMFSTRVPRKFHARSRIFSNFFFFLRFLACHVWSKMMLQVRAKPRSANISISYYLLHLRSTSAPRAGDGASLSGGFLERRVSHFKLRAGLGQDLLRSLVWNGEADPQSHLFLNSGPPLTRLPWDT